MTNKELEREFNRVIEERGLGFSSNLNPFDIFKLGYELCEIKMNQIELDPEIKSALNDFTKIATLKTPKKKRF
jgi:hypothetical protein